MGNYSIGVDIGASHVSCGLYNKKLQKLECKIYQLNHIDKAIDVSISTRKFIKIIINLIDKLIQENNIQINDVSSIGLGCPGGIVRNEGIFLGSAILNVEKINWRKELYKYNLKVFVENDCTCAGICESYINKWDNFIMFTLGSELGISYMQGYKCIDSIVWDIMKINEKIGTNNDKYIKSFSSLSKRYNSIKNGNYDRCEIFKCIEKGNIEAFDILKDYIENFVNGIIKIEQVYKIKQFSIGGGMSEYSKYFIKDIKNKLPNIDINIAKYKNDSGIVGGAILEDVQ